MGMKLLERSEKFYLFRAQKSSSNHQDKALASS